MAVMVSLHPCLLGSGFYAHICVDYTASCCYRCEVYCTDIRSLQQLLPC